jgi:thymidylate kinase
VSPILHINSWPGVGKLTIARLVAKELRGRLIDNHILLNPAEALFDRSDPLHRSLRKEIRSAFFKHAAQRSDSLLIFTDAFADEAVDRAAFEDYRTLAKDRQTKLVPVVLDCEHEENMRRLVAPGRSEVLKLTQPEILAKLRASYKLYYPDEAHRMDIDVSSLPAPDAAAQIVAHLKKIN